jgi:hypothetical protein
MAEKCGKLFSRNERNLLTRITLEISATKKIKVLKELPYRKNFSLPALHAAVGEPTVEIQGKLSESAAFTLYFFSNIADKILLCK